MIESKKKYLFTPGPSNIPKHIRNELSKDLIHHVTEEYSKLLLEVTEKLKKIFKTKETVLSITSTGTGGMEATVSNLFSREDKVIVINTGNFGERYKEICDIYGLEVLELKYEWGKSYILDDVKKILKKNTDIKGILVNHSETSTGVLNNIKELGELTKGTDILLVVDAISSLLINEFKFDEWNIDCAVTASQKGFLLPPGLTYYALSKKAISILEVSNLPKFYLDFKRYIYSLSQGRHPQTPAMNLISSTNYVCDYLLKIGIDNIVEQHKEMRLYFEERLLSLGFKLLVKKESEKSNAVIPVYYKDNYILTEVRKELSKKHNITVAGGYGHLNPYMLRVGNISLFEKEDVDFFIEKLAIVLLGIENKK